MSGRSPWQLVEVLATVPASPRATGPVRAASPERRALSRAAPTAAAQHPGRVVDPGRARALHRLGDQGDEVVGAVGERRVVSGPVVPPRSRRARRRSRGRGPRRAAAAGRAAVTPKQQSTQPVEVEAGARERHGGVQGERERRAARRPALEHREAVPPDVCTTSWPGLPRPRRGQACDELGQRVVGHGEDDELGARDDVGDGHARACRAAGRRTGPGLPRSRPRRR